jgi:hypothetical protein
MADDLSQSDDADSLDAELRALGLPNTEDEEVAAPAATDELQQGSGAKGMLREAIQKVMEEIAYHEREAEKHVQMAKALRKDLRDSFAFLQDRQDDVPTGASARSRPSESSASKGVGNATVGKAKDMVSASKPQRGHPKKKQTAKKD